MKIQLCVKPVYSDWCMYTHVMITLFSARVNSGLGVPNQIDFNLIEEIFAHINTANRKLPRTFSEGKLTKCKTMNF